MESYITVNGKRLRKGYTTGSCAAAAAKIAAYILINRQQINYAQINTPSGEKLIIPVETEEVNENFVRCHVIKDSGDDPDITNGIRIVATVSYSNKPGIELRAGEGIGTVTLPGLKVHIGQPAINPVPRKMILDEVSKELKEGMGVKVVISVPEGAEIAKKTFNPKLGIVGGISILGTTGIVTPMSEEAYKDALEVELNVIAAKGYKKIVYTFGNYGESFAKNDLGISEDRIIKISNFVGFMFEKAAEKNFEEILLIGHLGKLVKVAAGIFHTHSRMADARMEIMTAYAALEGAGQEEIKAIFDCKTTEAAAVIIKNGNYNGVFDRIAVNASKRCEDYTYGKLRVGVILFNEDNNLLSMDENAKKMIQTK